MSLRAHGGYTYLALMFVVALMGASLAAAGIFWHTAQMREKERELLYVGNQYRKAIELYYKAGKTYPRELPQLLRDQRAQDVRRYLRKLYRDPITNKNEWGLIKTPDGGIAGIFSLSEQAPIKIANFPLPYAEFEGKTKYSDWKFVYSPQNTPGGGAPGAGQQRAPGTGGAAGAQQGAPTGGRASGAQATSGTAGAQGGAPGGLQQGAQATSGAGSSQQSGSGTSGSLFQQQNTQGASGSLFQQSTSGTSRSIFQEQGTAGSSGSFFQQQGAPSTTSGSGQEQSSTSTSGGGGLLQQPASNTNR